MLTVLLLTLLTCPVLADVATTTPAVPAPSATLTDTEAAPESEELITRVHDLGGLLPRGAERAHAITPFSCEYELAPILDEDDGAAFMDAVISLLVDDLFEEELQYEGRRVEEFGHSLLLTAPDAVHRTLDAVAGYIRAASRRQAVLRVTRYAGQVGAVQLASRSLNEVARLTQEGQLSLVDDRRVELLLGVPWHERRELTTPLLSTWSVEIAQTSNIAVPEVLNHSAVTETALLVAPRVGGGFALRAASRQDQQRGMESRSLELSSMVIGEASRLDFSHDQTLELQRSALATLLGSATVQVGESLVLSAATGTLGQPVGSLMVVSLESVAPAPPALDLGAWALALVDSSAHTSRGGRSRMVSGRRMGGREPGNGELESVSHLDPEELSGWFPNAGIKRGGGLEGGFEQLMWAQGSLWEHGPWDLAWGPPEALQATLDELALRLAPPAGVVVEWELSGPDGRSAGAGGVLSTAGDADALSLAGELFGAVLGTEVQVATGSFAEEPRVVELVDGLCLRARPTGPDEVELTVALSACRSRQPGSLRPGAEGLFDRPVFDSADVRRSVPVDGARHLLCQIGDGAGGTLELWATARRGAPKR